jgi:hypothetical protein
MYTIQEHMHRFALWISARAAQRGVNSFTIENLNLLFEKINFRTEVTLAIENINNSNGFKTFHINICNKMIEKASFELTYGRASKIIAMYLKTICINQNTSNASISELIHPPIDAILLKAIGDDHIDLKMLKKIKWTQLSEAKYWNLIELLEKNNLPVNWKLESYWHPKD